jgi:acyl dehydratase
MWKRERAMAATIRYEDVEVGGELPRLTIGPLTRQDIVRYAGAACDFSPLHYDQPFVEAAGLPTVVVMGMFTAAMASRCITDFAGAGQVRNYKVRFVARIYPGDTINCAGKVTRKFEADGERLVEGELIVTNQKGEVALTATFRAAVG